MIESIDLYPTVAELCGLKGPKELEGESFVAVLQDPDRPFKKVTQTLIQLPRRNGRSVRTDRWRYIEWDEGRAGTELYDQESDPRELRNLAKDPAHAQTLADMKRLVLRPRVPSTAPVATSAPSLPWIKVAGDGHSLIRENGKPFTPWGFNYDRDYKSRLIEDYWTNEWATLREDFREMKAMGANVVRVHLQFGKFMISPDRPNWQSIDQLERLVLLAEDVGMHLDITGLGCYRKQDVPGWYDALDEPARWAAQARFWETIAQRLVDHPGVLAYDLMNEPVVPDRKLGRGGWLVNAPFGGFYYVQNVSLDPAGRDRSDVAKQWVHTLSAVIRKHDRRHLITLGMLPESGSGFDPEKISPELDYLSVHVYPKTGKLEDALSMLRQFNRGGKPVVVEEIFPLSCSAPELGQFIDRSGDEHLASGWLGFYWGQTPAELKNSKEIVDAMTLGWLELFTKKRVQMTQD